MIFETALYLSLIGIVDGIVRVVGWWRDVPHGSHVSAVAGTDRVRKRRTGVFDPEDDPEQHAPQDRPDGYRLFLR
jgi:hypothetical protein